MSTFLAQIVPVSNNWNWILPAPKRSLLEEHVPISYEMGDLLVKAYPNPFTDKINIEIESLVNTQTQITITDLAGRILHSNSLQLIKGKQLLELNELNVKGVLILSICPESENCNTQKLVAL